MAFCSNCGNQVPDGMAVCPRCNAPIAQAMPQQMGQPQPGGYQPGGYQPGAYQPAGYQPKPPMSQQDIKRYISMAVAGVVAIIMVVLVILWLVKLFAGLAPAIQDFGNKNDGLVSGLGIVFYIVACALPLVAAIISIIPLVQGLLRKNVTAQDIQKSIIVCGIFVVLCIILWIINLVGVGMKLNAGTTGLGYVAYYITIKTDCIESMAVGQLIPSIIALVILIATRIAVFGNNGTNAGAPYGGNPPMNYGQPQYPRR